MVQGEGTHLEIERSFLLRACPALPPEAIALRMEQGYLDPSAPGDDPSGIVEGRLRRVRHPDGRVECVHTVKRGSGLVREETEREIDATTFERLWAFTAGRRLSKTRHVVAHGDLKWEVDVFDDVDLVLVDVELPRADAPAPVPPWLEGWIEREVTDDPRYRNFAIALRIARGSGAPDGS
ncbi:MAG: hypothetical protein KDA25_09230 [Phycisphaerales bacterium]|nr:hypothetical protein [Phycisphaerales bacterium]